MTKKKKVLLLFNILHILIKTYKNKDTDIFSDRSAEIID